MRFRQRLLGGDLLRGAMYSFRSPEAAELLGHSGLDFLMIDAEHGSLGPESIQDLIRAVETTPASPLVRVPEVRPSLVQWALDAGAQGILFPQIRRVAEVEEAAALCRYPPRGRRGLGPGRAARYGLHLLEYARQAPETIAVLVQVETVEAVQELDSILAVEGVDAVFIGPGDLSHALGVTGELEHPRLLEVMEEVVAKCRRAGLPVGTLAMTEAAFRHWLEKGVSFFIIGADASFLLQGVRSALRWSRPREPEISSPAQES